ncbi:MAG TPA: helix-turn-helix domain-containing protein [Xanthobacteraceae bacterium]|nr:helix-turn-helix domain-containing protein [Xanthobacteraceae bacterium]
MKDDVRPYVMKARAESVAANRRRIIDCARRLVMARSFDAVTIDMVAADAGTTARTVLRLFGGKDELFAAALDSIGQFRPGPIVPGDTVALVSGTYDFYEKIGDTVIRWLADEPRLPAMRARLNIGRRHLRAWVAEAFAPALGRLQGTARKELHDALIVAFDVYAWKLLRRDFGLSRRAAEATTLRMVRSLIEERQDG